MSESETPSPKSDAHRLLQFAVAFGVIYFVQGISEPTTGLVSQPNQALLRDWGKNPEQVAAFVSLLTLPWCFKPLFGMLSDFVPLGAFRRKSYLLAACACAAIAFAVLATTPLAENEERPLLSWLMYASFAVIFGDVVIDALMVETAQPLGMTGRMQSVQWAAIYGGAILTGLGGGYLSAHHWQRLGFILCSALMTCSFILAAFFLEEQPRETPPRAWRKALPLLWTLSRSRRVLVVGSFMFLWNFNPFSQTVLYLHATEKLDFGENFIGRMNAVSAVGSLLACIAYAFYCRRVSMRWLVHLSILCGLICNSIYWVLARESGAYTISVIFGLTYMTGSIIQSDLAARACPLDAAGTLFALFMSICNLGSALSTWFGGYVYHHASALWSGEDAFHILIMMNAVFTAGCWLVVKFLPADLLGTPLEAANVEAQPLAETTVAV